MSDSEEEAPWVWRYEYSVRFQCLYDTVEGTLKVIPISPKDQAKLVAKVLDGKIISSESSDFPQSCMVVCKTDNHPDELSNFMLTFKDDWSSQYKVNCLHEGTHVDIIISGVTITELQR